MTVDITGETKGWSGLALTFTPSAKERYFYDVQMKDFYESFESDEAFMNELLYYYGGQGLLAYKQTIGQATLTVEEGLLPGTTYLGVAFAVDKQISTPLFTREFTTASVPMGGTATVTSIEPTIEDGDRYYESDPEKYADCKGKAVVGFKITTNAAAKYYVACFDPFTERPNDQQMTDLLVGYGDSEPAAYLLDWNEPCEVWALAMDNARSDTRTKLRHDRCDRTSVCGTSQDRPHRRPCLAPDAVVYTGTGSPFDSSGILCVEHCSARTGTYDLYPRRGRISDPEQPYSSAARHGPQLPRTLIRTA